MNWEFIPETKNVSALSISGDYVISHWGDYFILSFRPTGQHIHLGKFSEFKKTKDRAEEHNKNKT